MSATVGLMKVFHAASITALFAVCIAPASAQSDTGAIKAANDSFYAAISERDAGLIERAWDHDGVVFNIFGVSKAPMVGWNAVRTGYDDLFRRFTEILVTMPEPVVRQDGAIAIVVGVENQKATLASGDTVSAALPTTNLFVRRDGRWLLVHHHTSRPPQ